ncbi:MAG: hypothetical protein ACP5NC_08175, partial [Nitrososphaeria archaeon]
MILLRNIFGFISRLYNEKLTREQQEAGELRPAKASRFIDEVTCEIQHDCGGLVIHGIKLPRAF